ncbi:MAG: nucleotidyl transferase AbiEii/AbiGii toxin family protein, partial [Candidatus Aenigmatarchaeota archaeon]
ALNHHDKPSFIAGKCHAVLQREWAKGRDFFDLLFYLSRWKETQPNFEYLNNALDQTGYDKGEITPENWRKCLLERVKEISWSAVEEDVKPFLLKPADEELFSKEFLIDELSE